MNNSLKIGLVSATIICMNAMIGAGIFTTPAKLALTVGPAGIITYLFVIIAVLFMALSISRVAFAYPEEGSFYTYSKQWGGHFVGIAAAGSYIIGVIIAMGLLAQIAARYFYDFLPCIEKTTLGVLIVVVITILNVAGIRIVQTGQFILLSCTLFALFSTIFLCLLNANTENLTPFMPHGIYSLAQALSTAIFAFFGFESAASLYVLVEKPEKNVPIALTLSLCIVGSIYLAFIGSIILAIPSKIFVSPDMPISQALRSVFPQYRWLANLTGLAILTAICGVLQSMTYSISTLTQSFIKLLNPNFQELTKSKWSLQIIIIIVGLFVLFNFFTIKELGIFFNLTALFIVFAYACSIITLIVKKHDKTFIQRIITYGGICTAAIIFFNALYGLIEEMNKKTNLSTQISNKTSKPKT